MRDVGRVLEIQAGFLHMNDAFPNHATFNNTAVAYLTWHLCNRGGRYVLLDSRFSQSRSSYSSEWLTRRRYSIHETRTVGPIKSDFDNVNETVTW